MARDDMETDRGGPTIYAPAVARCIHRSQGRAVVNRMPVIVTIPHAEADK